MGYRSVQVAANRLLTFDRLLAEDPPVYRELLSISEPLDLTHPYDSRGKKKRYVLVQEDTIATVVRILAIPP